ncbi:hypothetical protein I308_102673 [Cryptococcus tetragattii IND107]|uniref:Uncharacterized protein n=1 Tax=Cryptococcus tetragattii IND107 TaxID=1296105 RepID=A0ABR3BU78_9TREE
MVVSRHHVTEKETDIVSTPTKGGRNSALLLFARRSSVVRFVHDAVTVRSGAYTSYTENYFRDISIQSFAGICQKQEEPVIPSMNELLSKKSIKSAWAALSTTKKLLFGVFVLVGGAGDALPESQ